MKRITALGLAFCILALFGTANNLHAFEKMKGVSFVASSSPITSKNVMPIVNINANWVTLMPYGYVDDSGQIQYNVNWQWWGERVEGLEKTIDLCKVQGLKIMIKPQIWFPNKYTGDYVLETEEEWLVFEKSYSEFIHTFLKVAQEKEVALFCIGTEWREFVKQREPFWKGLIKEIRKEYKGKLTYAANWDDYDAVPFWDLVDYVGIDGYFPISLSEKPKLNELIEGWSLHAKVLKNFAKSTGKKIILTEIGYRSVVGATLKPWEHGKGGVFSEEIQADAYRALFKVLWDEDWFQGMFIWKWFDNHAKSGGKGNTYFTPQNKLAEKVIQAQWAK